MADMATGVPVYAVHTWKKSGSIVGTTRSSRYMYYDATAKTRNFTGGSLAVASGIVTLFSGINYCVLSSTAAFSVKTTEMSSYISTTLFSYDGVSTDILINNSGGSTITLTGVGISTVYAAFTASAVTGSVPISITFTDGSNGTPTSWAWTFGDGGTSTSQNPVHSYIVAGTYDVTLTVTDKSGTSDTVTYTNFITVI